MSSQPGIVILSVERRISLTELRGNLATDALQIRAVRLTDSHHRRLFHGIHNEILAEQ